MVGQKGIPCAQGGIERYVEEISTRLVKYGHEVVVYTRPYYTPKTQKEYNGVKLVSLPSLKTKHLDAISHSLLACMHAIFIARADIIHFQNIGPALVCWMPRLFLSKAKVIGTFQSQDWMHLKWGAVAKFSFKLGAWCMCKFSHKTMAVSKQIQQYAKEKFGVDLPIISNGVTLKPQLDPESVNKALISFGLEKEKYLFTSARLIKHKGIHYLVNAFNLVKSNGIPAEYKNIKLVVAGEGFYSDDYVNELKAKCADNEDIKLVGWQTGETLQALNEAALIYIQPSEAEGMSMSLLEAMGYGRQVLVSDIPANMEAIESSEGGYVGAYFKSKSVDDLATKVDQMLSNNPNQGESARQKITAEYNWDTIAEKLNDFYQS